MRRRLATGQLPVLEIGRHCHRCSWHTLPRQRLSYSRSAPLGPCAERFSVFRTRASPEVGEAQGTPWFAGGRAAAKHYFVLVWLPRWHCADEVVSGRLAVLRGGGGGVTRSSLHVPQKTADFGKSGIGPIGLIGPIFLLGSESSTVISQNGRSVGGRRYPDYHCPSRVVTPRV